jgi:hypothetical protein
MEVTYSLFWFMVGAVLMRALSAYSNQKEQKDMIVKIMAQFLVMSQEFKMHLDLALQLKKKVLEESKVEHEEIQKMCADEEQVIENWSVVCSTIILRGAPKSYLKYFQDTKFKDFKPKE